MNKKLFKLTTSFSQCIHLYKPLWCTYCLLYCVNKFNFFLNQNIGTRGNCGHLVYPDTMITKKQQFYVEWLVVLSDTCLWYTMVIIFLPNMRYRCFQWKKRVTHRTRRIFRVATLSGNISFVCMVINNITNVEDYGSEYITCSLIIYQNTF